MAAPKWTKEDDEKISRWFSSGLSAGDIAKRLSGRTRNAVIGRLMRLGLKRGDQNLPAVDDIQWLRCDLGWAEHSIAQALDCNLDYVERVVSEHTSPEFGA
jgi:hypothetical protein